MPSRKKAPPQVAAPLTAPDRIQHLHNLAHDLDVATRAAHAGRQSARDRFSAEGVGDPLTPPDKKRRRGEYD